MPHSTDLPVQVVQLTDTHLFADAAGTLLGLNTDTSLTKVIDLVKQQHLPNIVVASGDLSHDGSGEAYQRLRENFSRLLTPVYCLPGNHDETITLRTQLNDGLLRTCHKMVTANGWQMVFVDSTKAGSEAGHISEQELYQLNETLTNSPAQPTLVWLHHQPLPIGSRWLDNMVVDNGNDFFSVLERHTQVRAVIWGHIHQQYETEHKHFRLLSSPSTCIQFKPGSDQFSLDPLPPGYRWLKLYKDGTFDTGIERLAEIPGEIDMDNTCYS
jgi:Icc protein